LTTSIDSASKALAGSREMGSPLGRFSFRIGWDCDVPSSESPDVPHAERIRAMAMNSAIVARHPFFTPIPPVEAEKFLLLKHSTDGTVFPPFGVAFARKKEPRFAVKKGYKEFLDARSDFHGHPLCGRDGGKRLVKPGKAAGPGRSLPLSSGRHQGMALPPGRR